MAAKRFSTIHFTEGNKLSMTFPQQAGDFSQIASRVRKTLDANQPAIEIEGELFVIQMSNVKYLQVKPAPEKLSDTIIRSGSLK